MIHVTLNIDVGDDGDDSGVSSAEIIVNVVDDCFINLLSFIKFGSSEAHLETYSQLNIKLFRFFNLFCYNVQKKLCIKNVQKKLPIQFV